MEISIIIVNWNTKDLLQQCLKSIYKYCLTKFEIIVVDNGSHDGSVEMINEQFKDIVLIANQDNLGFAQANNQAIKVANGDYILLLNSDTYFIEDSITKMLDFIMTDKAIGVVSCQLIYPHGRIQYSCRGFPTPSALFYFSIGLSLLFKNKKYSSWKMEYFSHDKTIEVEQPMMSVMLISRDCLNRVGLLDENFPIYFNDVDWCYRVKKDSNYKIYFFAETKVVHYYGESGKKLGIKKIIKSTIGLKKFYLKHIIKNKFSLSYSVLLIYLVLTLFYRTIFYILKNLRSGKE